MHHIHLFISAVTDEFGSYREALRDDLDRYNVSVKTQETFVESGHVFMHKLDGYIRHCEAVIHLAGDMTGSLAKPESAAWLRNQYPDMVQRFPVLKAALEGTEQLSYTQWEAWLALYHNRELYIAQPTANAPRDAKFVQDPAQQAMQQQHRKRLHGINRRAFSFTDTRDLSFQLLRSQLYDLLQVASTRKRPQNLPYRSFGSLFKGRDAFMAELRQSLHGAPAGQASVLTGSHVLHGLGGIGKTRLAVEYAWQHRDDYNALLFVFADSPQALNTNLAALCGPLVLDLPEQDAKEEAVKVEAALNWLRENPGWFLILDNVDKPEATAEVEKLLKEVLRGGHVLITSRISQWSGQVITLELNALNEEAAADFLLERTNDRRLKTTTDAAAAHTLAKHLGSLALGLEQAGSYIHTRRLSLAQYTEAWQRNHDELSQWKDERQMQYPRSVAVTWKTSFDQLQPAAQRLMNRLVWLSPEPIPESLLDTPVPGDETGDDPWEALGEVEKYSLISRAQSKPEFAVHRLMQDVACRMMDKETKREALVEALGWVDEAFEGDPQDVHSWPVLDPLWPHALQLVWKAEANDYGDRVSRLSNQLGLLMLTKARHEEAEPLMRRALDIDERRYGPDHPKVATDLNNLALLLQDTNRLAEAEPHMRRALDIDERSYGPDLPIVAIRLNNLAQLLQATNRLPEAEPLMRRALDIDERSYGPDHPNVANRLNNLAALFYNTNRLAEAELLMRRALNIDERSYGSDHPKVATGLNNLAALLSSTNRFAEAEPLIRRALDIDERSYGSEHPMISVRLNNLAGLLQDTNRLAEAEPLMCRALDIDERSYGPDHPKVATDLNNLASLLQATHRLPEAEPLMRRALDIDERSYGPDHPMVAIRLNNLSQLLQDTNRLPEAEPLMRRVLLILIAFQKATGHEHPHLRPIINNYGTLLMEMDHTQEEAATKIHALIEEA